jgi:hypothetical protein
MCIIWQYYVDYTMLKGNKLRTYKPHYGTNLCPQIVLDIDKILQNA